MPRKAAGNPLTARIAVEPETLKIIQSIAYGLKSNQNQAIRTLAAYFTGNGDPEQVAQEYRKAQEKLR